MLCASTRWRSRVKIVVLVAPLLLHSNGVAHAQPTATPTLAPTPNLTWTPTPTPEVTPAWVRSHAIMTKSQKNLYFGARARIWTGAPLLRWPDFSYGAIWVNGERSVLPTAAEFPTATPMMTKTPTPNNPAEPTPAGLLILPVSASFDSQGERESLQDNPIMPLSVLQQPTPTPSSLPTPTPTSIPTRPPGTPNPSTGDLGLTWVEAGFDRDASYAMSKPACMMSATWAMSPGHPHWAFQALGGAIYDVEIYRTDKYPSYAGVPPNPNPSTPYWSVRFYHAESTTGHLLLFIKNDIQPNMLVGDQIQMGGEVVNVWPAATPLPIGKLNDMGIHDFARAQYLYVNAGTGQSIWDTWRNPKPEKVDDPKVTLWWTPWRRTKYAIGRDSYRVAPDGQHPFWATGYQGVSMDNTWRPCNCHTSGGIVLCNDPPAQSGPTPASFP